MLIGLLLFLLGKEIEGAVGAGFLPARLSGVELPPELDWGIPAWATMLSYGFVHAGLLHLGFNMVMFAFVGQRSERAVGSAGLAVLYGVGAVAAAAAQWAENPLSEQPMVGASGAISAVLGAYAILYGRGKARAIGPIPAGLVNGLWLFAAWSAINLIAAPVFENAGLAIAAAAHIGGFAVGLVLAKPLLWWHYRRA